MAKRKAQAAQTMPNNAAAILRTGVRSKCASCGTFAIAMPDAPDASCQCGKLTIVGMEIMTGNSMPFTEEEFLAAVRGE